MLDLTDRTHCFYWQTDRKLSGQDYVRIFLHRHEISAEEIGNVLLKGITTIKPVSNIKVSEPDANVLKGNVNIVRKVDINGTTYVVRMHPHGVKNGYFYTEKLTLDECLKKKLPVPKVLEIHEATDEADMDFMLMTMSPGENMDVYLFTHKDTENELLFNCGAHMAHIHAIRTERYGFFDNAAAKTGALVGLHSTYHDFIHTGLDENVQRLITFKILTDDQARKFKQLFDQINFEPCDGPRLIQNDMADWNLLTDGKKITGILDWDECHSGDPIADIACWSTFFSLARLRHFIEGYTSVTDLPGDYDDRFHFYRLRYTISKMALRCKRYEVDKNKFVAEKIEVGKQALIDESHWFNL